MIVMGQSVCEFAIPESLYEFLKLEAKKEGVDLNTLMFTKLCIKLSEAYNLPPE